MFSLFFSKATAVKMSMTAPVRSVGGEKRSPLKISFVLPSKYSKASAPRPLSSSVSVRQLPSHLLAARKFAGPPPSDLRVAREKARVVAALEKAGLTAAKRGPSGEGPLVVYGYHDPFITPNLLRRNEVGVYVRGGA